MAAPLPTRRLRSSLPYYYSIEEAAPADNVASKQGHRRACCPRPPPGTRMERSRGAGRALLALALMCAAAAARGVETKIGKELNKVNTQQRSCGQVKEAVHSCLVAIVASENATRDNICGAKCAQSTSTPRPPPPPLALGPRPSSARRATKHGAHPRNPRRARISRSQISWTWKYSARRRQTGTTTRSTSYSSPRSAMRPLRVLAHLPWPACACCACCTHPYVSPTRGAWIIITIITDLVLLCAECQLRLAGHG